MTNTDKTRTIIVYSSRAAFHFPDLTVNMDMYWKSTTVDTYKVPADWTRKEVKKYLIIMGYMDGNAKKKE